MGRTELTWASELWPQVPAPLFLGLNLRLEEALQAYWVSGHVFFLCASNNTLSLHLEWGQA